MILVLTVGLLLVTSVASFGSLRGGLEREFFPAEDSILVHRTLKKNTVSSHVVCGRDCSLEEGCKSFNYNKCSKLCVLNNSTRSDHPESFSKDWSSVYFDDNASTPLTGPQKKKSADSGLYKSCKELLKAGYSTSGIFNIHPVGTSDGFDVYCDMETDGGGWIVFQRRQDGSVDFYRTWAEYQCGFGDLNGEHWLGNDNLVSLTSDTTRGPWELRVEITDWDNVKAHAIYTKFKITGQEYTMNYDQYIASSAGNSLYHDKGQPFSTKDHGGSCAQTLQGAWWFGQCSHCHLNGRYYPSGQNQGGKGIIWCRNTANVNPLKESVMKIRETG